MEWTAEAVGQWIDKDGNWSGKQFAQAQIDGKRVLALTDQDLKPLGMNARDCKEFFADTYPQLKAAILATSDAKPAAPSTNTFTKALAGLSLKGSGTPSKPATPAPSAAAEEVDINDLIYEDAVAGCMRTPEEYDAIKKGKMPAVPNSPAATPAFQPPPVFKSPPPPPGSKSAPTPALKKSPAPGPPAPPAPPAPALQSSSTKGGNVTCSKCKGAGEFKVEGYNTPHGPQTRSFHCDKCDGEGSYYVPPTSTSACSKCKGTGEFKVEGYNTPHGPQTRSFHCDKCDGEGTITRIVYTPKKCPTCKGTGEMKMYGYDTPDGSRMFHCNRCDGDGTI